MKYYCACLLILVSICTTSIVNAQDQDAEDHFYSNTLIAINPKHSFSLELGLPVILANKFNKKTMSGLVYLSPYYQYSFENHFSIGAGAFYTLSNINTIATSENINGSSNLMGGFLKLAYEKFHNSRFATDFGVKLGYAEAIYLSNKLKQEGRTSMDNGLYIEPNLGFVLTVAEKSSFRFFVGYQFIGIPFDNKKIAMESDGALSSNGFKKLQQNLIFGFGYTFYIKTRN